MSWPSYLLGLLTLPAIGSLVMLWLVLSPRRVAWDHNTSAIEQAELAGSKPASDDPADVAAWRLDKIYEFSSYRAYPQGHIGGYEGSWHDGTEAEISRIIRDCYEAPLSGRRGGETL